MHFNGVLFADMWTTGSRNL